MMKGEELLNIEPSELKFSFELRKQISCKLQLTNKTDNYVAFKVLITNPKNYCVRPKTGVVLPRSTCDVIVVMQAQTEAPLNLQCKDKFLIQSVIALKGTTSENITPEMFSKEGGNDIQECKLKVIYVCPPQPPHSSHLPYPWNKYPGVNINMDGKNGGIYEQVDGVID